MKITNVETLYLRQPEVKDHCDSGQDALIVRVSTDAAITGIGEVDSSPMACGRGGSLSRRVTTSPPTRVGGPALQPQTLTARYPRATLA
jgi:L-alanine-DL-glutamate epimerase-like enolase superfamily enzyme